MTIIRRVVLALSILAIGCTDSAATPSSQESYRWMAAPNTAELGARIVASPGSRLEIREDAAHKLYFRVVTPGAKAQVKDLDDTFICPPIC